MAQHIQVKRYFRPQDNSTQAILSALPIPTQIISPRITMVADNPRAGIAHRIANRITPEAATLHWAMDQLKIDHLMVLGSVTDNTSSWRYGYRETGCCRVAYNALAVSHAAVNMSWHHRNGWQAQFGTAPTESETVIHNMITELNSQHQRRLEHIQDRIDRRCQQRVERMTQTAHQRAEQKVKAQLAAKLRIIERFRDTGIPAAAINNVIKDPVYRFTVGIANSNLAPEKTGTDK